MQRLVINMQNFVFGEAIERALQAEGSFIVTTVEKPADVAKECRLTAATALLMEVTGYTLAIKRAAYNPRSVKGRPDIKIVLSRRKFRKIRQGG